MGRFLSAVVLCAGLVAAAPSTSMAQVQDADATVAAIREQILFARYDDAVAAARTYLGRTDLSAAQRNAGLEVLAIAHLANRDATRASDVLTLLYSRDPGHRLTDPDASPMVQGAFARAREARPPRVDVVLEHTPPVLSRRESPEVSVRVTEGRDAVSEVRLSYRTGTAGRFAQLVMELDADGIARARLPLVGDPAHEQPVDYTLTAMAPSLTPLAHLASEAEPLTLVIPRALRQAPTTAPVLPATTATTAAEPEASPGGGVATKWWFWTLMVGVVAGGVTAALLVTRPSDPDGSLGHVTLR